MTDEERRWRGNRHGCLADVCINIAFMLFAVFVGMKFGVMFGVLFFGAWILAFGLMAVFLAAKDEEG